MKDLRNKRSVTTVGSVTLAQDYHIMESGVLPKYYISRSRSRVGMKYTLSARIKFDSEVM